MTQGEKAKAYDEALKRAKEAAEKGMVSHNFVSDIFPELNESEDEKIMKDIVEAVELHKDFTQERKEHIYAWLEKQDEKTSDKAEPKFKVGDWVVQENIGVYKVIEICKSWYEVIDFENNHYSISFDNEHMCYLWTIKDAKPGDVIYLPNGDNEHFLFIFKGIENAAVMSFAHFYQYNDGTSEVEGTTDKLSSANDVFQPSTKEQCELLFAKMKEAGYEWDADKKELKKVGQKPIWSEDDELNFKQAIYVCHQHHYFEVETWLKNLKDRVQLQYK